MLHAAKFVNAEDAGINYVFLDDGDPDFPVVAPFTEVDITIDQRVTTSRNKMQRHGVNPTYTYSGGMHLDITGDLFRETSEDYWTERRSLIEAIRYLPDNLPTHRVMGTLFLWFAGDDEYSTCDVTVEQMSLPILALYPAYTQFMVTFFSAVPWFTGATSGDTYWMA